MIDGLDTDDSGLKRMLVLVNVSHQIQLCGRRPRNEHLFGAFERPGDLVEESLGVIGMLPGSFGSFWMFVVSIVKRSRNGDFIGSFKLDVEDSSFLVINPNGDLFSHNAYFDSRE